MPQGSILDTMLFNIFLNDLNKGMEGILIMCADDTNRLGAANTLKEWIGFMIQNDLECFS